MSASIVALFLVHCIKSAFMSVQFSTFYVLLLFSLLPFSQRLSRHVARAISPVVMFCVCLCSPVVAGSLQWGAAGWGSCTVSAWGGRTQERNMATAAAGGWTSGTGTFTGVHPPPTSEQRCWGGGGGGGGGEMVVLITGTSTQPSIPTSLHTLVF